MCSRGYSCLAEGLAGPGSAVDVDVIDDGGGSGGFRHAGGGTFVLHDGGVAFPGGDSVVDVNLEAVLADFGFGELGADGVFDGGVGGGAGWGRVRGGERVDGGEGNQEKRSQESPHKEEVGGGRARLSGGVAERHGDEIGLGVGGGEVAVRGQGGGEGAGGDGEEFLDEGGGVEAGVDAAEGESPARHEAEVGGEGAAGVADGDGEVDEVVDEAGFGREDAVDELLAAADGGEDAAVAAGGVGAGEFGLTGFKEAVMDGGEEGGEEFRGGPPEAAHHAGVEDVVGELATVVAGAGATGGVDEEREGAAGVGEAIGEGEVEGREFVAEGALDGLANGSEDGGEGGGAFQGGGAPEGDGVVVEGFAEFAGWVVGRFHEFSRFLFRFGQSPHLRFDCIGGGVRRRGLAGDWAGG